MLNRHPYVAQSPSVAVRSLLGDKRRGTRGGWAKMDSQHTHSFQCLPPVELPAMADPVHREA
eukprot:399254-Rhodomonas_salina.2